MDIDFLREIKIKEQSLEEAPAILTANTFSVDNSSFLKYARLLVYILVFLVPLFFLPWTSEVIEFNKQFLIFILAMAGLILYLAQIISSGRLIVKRNPANYAVLIFIGVILLAFWFSDFRYQSLFGGFAAGFQQSIVSLAGFAILFFLILNVFGVGQGTDHDQVKEDASKLLNIFSLSLFLALFLGVLQLFGFTIFKILGITQKNFNTVGTFNNLGMISAVLLAFSFSKLGLRKNSYFNYLKIPAAALSLFFLLILNWWVLWLAAISGMVFVLVSSSLSNRRVLNHFGPAAIIGLAVILILSNFNLAGIFGITLPLEVAPSFSASFGITEDVLKASSLFGLGPENFPLAYDLYKPISINNTVFWNVRFLEATSEFFNSLISYGVFGFLAFILLISTGFYLGFKNKGLLPIFATLAAIWVLYPFNMTLGFSFWLVFGLLALSISKKEDELVIDLEKSPKYSLITTVSFVGIVALAFISFYYVTSKYVANMKFTKALSSQEVELQTKLLADAVNLNRNEGMYSRALADLLVSRINQDLKNLNNAKTTEERQSIIKRMQDFSTTAISLSGEISQRNPHDSLNWFSRALVYENLINLIDGSDELAIKMYQEYSKFSPKDPVPYLRSGNVNLGKAQFLNQIISQNPNLDAQSRVNLQNQIIDNLKLAEENYKKAIELKINYVLAIYNLGAIYEREGRVKDAITQLEIIGANNSSDANIALQLGLLYYRDNQKIKSLNELQRAIAIFPDFSNARWYLALLFEERGQLSDALRELYKIREFNPDNQTLENKISELEKGIRSIPPQRVTGIGPLEEQNQTQ